MPDADPDLPDVPGPVEADGCGRPAGRLRRVARVAVPFALVGGAVYVVLAMAGGVAEGIEALRTVRPAWVAAAVGAELVAFLAFSGLLVGLGGPAANVRRLAPLRLALLVYGLGSSLPAAPAEGLVMAGTVLRRRRVSRRRVLVVLGVSQWFSDAGLYIVAGLNALVVASFVDIRWANRPLLAAAGAGTLAGIVGLGWLCTRKSFAERVAIIAGRVRRFRNPPPVQERRQRGAAWHDAIMHVVSGPRQWAQLLVLGSLVWVADAVCLHFSLLALGATISLPLLLLAYTAGAVASQVPLLPAGLGIVETMVPAMLHLAGAPWPAALASIVVYRLVATALPAAAGGLALLSLGTSRSPSDSTSPSESPPRVAVPNIGLTRTARSCGAGDWPGQPVGARKVNQSSRSANRWQT